MKVRGSGSLRRNCQLNQTPQIPHVLVLFHIQRLAAVGQQYVPHVYAHAQRFERLSSA